MKDGFLTPLTHAVDMLATREQLRAFRGALSCLNLQEMKDALVLQFTENRTTHSSEMQLHEMRALLTHLQGNNNDKFNITRADHMRRRIFSMCYSLGWTVVDPLTGKQKADSERLKNWLLKYGYKHKELADYEYWELPRLVTQFENMLKSTYA